jgi:hypothetical protein
MQWRAVPSLSVDTFVESADHRAMECSLGMMDQHQSKALPGFFRRPGWLRAVKEWIEGQAATAGFRLTGTFRQLNASPTFSLIRFETDGPALWFKAVGAPNLGEYSITLALASAFPNFVPQVLAAKPEWNAWLTTEVAGSHPDGRSRHYVWTAVARQIAKLQIATIGHSQHLMDAGCHDARTLSLVGAVEPFLEATAGFMKRQTTTSPAPLSRTDLLLLGRQLRNALSALADSDIPDVLGHLDLNPRNILVSENSCIFLDWAEACIGHPVLAFQLFLEHLRRLHSIHDQRQEELVRAYVEAWRPLVEPRQLLQALGFAPLLAAFAHVIGSNIWSAADPYCGDATAKLCRSISRRMKREANALSSAQSHRIDLCQN